MTNGQSRLRFRFSLFFVDFSQTIFLFCLCVALGSKWIRQWTIKKIHVPIGDKQNYTFYTLKFLVENLRNYPIEKK